MTTNPFATAIPDTIQPLSPVSGTGEQDRAVAAVLAWHNSKSRKQVFRLFGPAGTGKTTIARTIAERVNGTVLFAAFSGKAASVLRQKGNSNAATIHKLIYTPTDTDSKGNVTHIINNASVIRSAELVIIDECSMVNGKMGRDLESFRVPILVLGDKAQLPPIEGAGYFTKAAADFDLTQIHRQAENDPIVILASRARENKALKVGSYGESQVLSAQQLNYRDVIGADQVLVGTWSKIAYLNARIRQILGRPHGEPVAGDKLVCRKNSTRQNLFNGEIWVVHHVTEMKNGVIRMVVRSEIDHRDVDVVVDQAFFDVQNREELDALVAHNKGKHAFTFGYALSVHQAQGSEWDRVVLFDESQAWRDDNSKWLYTGITRASKSILIVRP